MQVGNVYYSLLCDQWLIKFLTLYSLAMVINTLCYLLALPV